VIYQQHWHPPEPQAAERARRMARRDLAARGLTPMTCISSRIIACRRRGRGGRDLLRFVPSAGRAGLVGELLTDQRPVDASA